MVGRVQVLAQLPVEAGLFGNWDIVHIATLFAPEIWAFRMLSFNGGG